MADITLTAGQFGDVVTFAVQSYVSSAANSLTTMNLSGATVTWVAEDGIQRVMNIVSAGSGVVTYTTSVGEFTAPNAQLGYLVVSFGTTGRYFSKPPFTLQIEGYFGVVN